MRGSVPGLLSRYPIGDQLPAMFAEDDFAQRFVAGLDDVIAPILSTLDCLDAYLDPELAPADFVDWLAGWVGLPIDESWTLAQRRELVSRAVELHRTRGTEKGLVAYLELVTGGEVDVTESGGCAWSQRPGSDLPGSDQPYLHVKVRVAGRTKVDEPRIDALIMELKPAHLPHTLEVVRGQS